MDDDEADAANAVYGLLVNGNGDVWLDAQTGEPVLLQAAPIVLRWDDQKMLKQKDVAEMAGVDRSTVYRAVRAGKLDVHKVDGKHARILMEDAKAWIRGEHRKQQKRKHQK